MQERVRPWSTQLVVPTDQGRLWFKANCPGLDFEPALHAVLAELEPDEIDAPFAVDVERGWLLTRDRGVTLGDSHPATAEDWADVVSTAAGLQLRLTPHRERLLAAGLPDCGPETVLGRYDTMIDRLAALPGEHPSHLPSERARELRERREIVEDAVALLRGGPLPTTLQHGDLHPRNVFAVDGALRVFDFGDSQWAHALEILAVPYGYLTRLTALAWEPVLTAYAAVWADLASPGDLERLMPAAMTTQAVNRSQTWWDAVSVATEEELVEWGDSPRYFLELVLEPFPPPAGPQP